MKKALSLLAAALLCTASAQTLTPAVKKSIDNHAYAFTKQHCGSKYTSKPPRAIPANRFNFVVNMVDMTFQEAKKEHPELIFRSDNNGKDLYRAQVGMKGNMAFMVGYLQQGQFYIYGCELR